MLKRTNLYRVFAMLMLAGLLALPATAATTIEPNGWLYGDEAEAALEKAEKYDVPVAIMHTFRETTCPKCVGAAQVLSTPSTHKKMVRVLVYVGGDSDLNSPRAMALFKKIRGDVNRTSNYIPDLYYTTADGQALGYVDYEDAADARAESSTVLKIAQWIDSAKKDIARADRDAERGRYTRAIDAISTIVQQEAKVSHLRQIQLGKVDKDAAMPEQPVSVFFPGLLDEKRAAYLKLAKAELDKARKLVEAGELRDAQRAARTLMRGPDDFETTAQAKALYEEIIDKLRAASAK